MRHSTRAMLDNRSRQLNSQDVRYAQSRGLAPAAPPPAPLAPEPSNPHGTVKPDSVQEKR